MVLDLRCTYWCYCVGHNTVRSTRRIHRALRCTTQSDSARTIGAKLSTVLAFPSVVSLNGSIRIYAGHEMHSSSIARVQYSTPAEAIIVLILLPLLLHTAVLI